MSALTKRQKSASSLVIGTHSGTFQADEAMGVWMLRQHPAYFQSKVVRSRDLEVLGPLDIVIDVAGEYDHAKLRYDHHQRGFEETLSECGFDIKLSATGLVYRHYGKDVICELYPALKSEPAKLETVYSKFYKSFVQALDAIDNGVEIAKNPRYSDGTGLSARVGRLNKRWNDTSESPTEDERFEKASAICGEAFVESLSYIVECEMAAYDLVEKAVLARNAVDPSGQIIKFESGGMPWKQHLYDLEAVHNIEGQVKFVLYTDQGGMWRVQAVTVKGTAFTNRVGLLESWRGVRDAELEKVSGIPGCKFVHNSGFIGGNKEFEGALLMAQKSIAGA
mmetsp:Transcript_29240/g.55230  ORF Transcript_29240/g.55230 Transcript_29240/m.55230 type:complete len:336 (+) Transcript_29240:97-1104(+)